MGGGRRRGGEGGRGGVNICANIRGFIFGFLYVQRFQYSLQSQDVLRMLVPGANTEFEMLLLGHGLTYRRM